METYHITVKGRVQGVFFRKYTQSTAERLQIRGTVRNTPSGDVDIIARGDKNQVDRFIQWCWQGSPHSHVTDVIVSQIETEEEYTTFRVTY